MTTRTDVKHCVFGCSKYVEYRGLYLTQVSWNLFYVCRLFGGKKPTHFANIFAVDLDSALDIVDQKYDQLMK